MTDSRSKPRILLFDPYATGHHAFYTGEVARELAASADVVAVVSDEVDLSDTPVRTVGTIARERSMDRRFTSREFARAIREQRPDAAIHLYADLDLTVLAYSKSLDVPTTLVVFKPCAHYRREFGTALQGRERFKAKLIELSMGMWLRRGRENRAMSLDEYAAAGWARRFPGQVAWWPEPGVPEIPPVGTDRRVGNVLIYGSLESRKGVGELCAAAAISNEIRSITIAGRVQPAFAKELRVAVDTAEAAGIEVDLQDRWISDEDAARMMREASAVAVTYRRHIGMSRVLLEAAAAGTPVVSTDFGLTGRLVREYGLGATADISDAHQLAKAIDRVLAERPQDRSAALESFAQRYSPERRAEAVSFLLETVASG